jgi:hypothetical protein
LLVARGTYSGSAFHFLQLHRGHTALQGVILRVLERRARIGDALPKHAL